MCIDVLSAPIGPCIRRTVLQGDCNRKSPCYEQSSVVAIAVFLFHIGHQIKRLLLLFH